MGAPTWWDVLEHIEDTQGRGASRYLADQLGVTVRTAQRYLSGQHQPTRHAVRDRLAGVSADLEAERAADQEAEYAGQLEEQSRAHRRETADYLRLMTVLHPPQITVRNTSDSKVKDKTYNISRPLDRMGPGLAGVADLWERGDYAGADAALSDAVIARWNSEPSDDRHGLAMVLQVIDYPYGIDYS